MRISKSLALIGLSCALVSVCAVAPTFSWYPHNGSQEGKSIHYEDDIELSAKTDSITAKTYTCDRYGAVGQNPSLVNTVNVGSEAVVYYKTTVENTGTNDIMLDLAASELPNNADFVIGTISPTLNEKAFASRPVRSKASNDTVRIYFKTNTSYSSFWAHGKDESGYNTLSLENEGNTGNGTTCEINMAYSVGGTETKVMMNKCPDNDTNWKNTGVKVYYYDIPSNADYFFFFNKWYMKLSDSTKIWNCTKHITDLSPGKLYYLTGKSLNVGGDEAEKDYAVNSTDSELVAINSYYKTVRMSRGESVSADIGLKKESENEEEDFVPDYFGKSISYSSSNASVASVNKDGLIIPAAGATTTSGSEDNPITVTTTVTGKFGDTMSRETSVSIPSMIKQVSVIKNVRVKAGGSEDIYWYALNKSHNETMTTSSIFYTF